MTTIATIRKKTETKRPELDLSFMPLPSSTKVYESGTIHPAVQVPFREIQLSKTVDSDNVETENLPLRVYDTSGPYTDSSQNCNIENGLPLLRQPWILERL